MTKDSSDLTIPTQDASDRQPRAQQRWQPFDRILLAGAVLSCLVAVAIFAWRTWGPGQSPAAPLPLIVYTSESGGGGQRVVRANLDGTGKTALVEAQSQPNKYAPRLSPDGKWVVFSAPNGETLPGGAFDILEFFLLKPKSVYAHEMAFDAFIAPGGGGAAARLTTLNEDQPYPIWLDNSSVALIGANGLYKVTINAEGQLAGTPEVISPGALHSTVTWHGP